jgi:hypothetical protein
MARGPLSCQPQMVTALALSAGCPAVNMGNPFSNFQTPGGGVEIRIGAATSCRTRSSISSSEASAGPERVRTRPGAARRAASSFFTLPLMFAIFLRHLLELLDPD